MKKLPLLLSLLLCHCFIMVSIAQPVRELKSQIIQKDYTFYSDTLYKIVGNILIAENVILQIEPGTKIQLNADVRITIDGTLKAKGTWRDTIHFSGDRWGGIIFSPGSTSWANGKGSVLEYCKIDSVRMYNSYAIKLLGSKPLIKNVSIIGCENGIFSESEGIKIDSISLTNVRYSVLDFRKQSTVSHSTFNNSNGTIELRGGSVFRHNIVRNSGSLQALSISSTVTNGKADSILYNDFIDNRGFAITMGGINAGVEVHIRYNNFMNRNSDILINGMGISPVDGKVFISKNNFAHKSADYFIKVIGSNGADATLNYWGGLEVAALEEFFLHKFDDYNLGEIVYLPLSMDSILSAGAAKWARDMKNNVFAPPGAQWHYSQATLNPAITTFKTFESIGDTLIKGVDCRVVVEVERMGEFTSKTTRHFFTSRNDSVYFFRNNGFHLLYDFAALPGDTITLGYFLTHDQKPLTMIIDSLSTLQINGHQRTVQHITSGDGMSIEFGSQVIEGIGSTSFLFPTPDFSGDGPLRCYSDNMLGHFKNPFYSGTGWSGTDCQEIINTSPVWIRKGAVWHYDWWVPASGGFEKIEYVKDTLIDNKLCNKLVATAYEFTMNQNRDIIFVGKHVSRNYFTYASGDTVFHRVDGKFYVLYDFGAKPGDTWEIGGETNAFNCSRSFVKVDSIGTMEIDGKSYRWISLSTLPDSGMGLHGKVVERLGAIDAYLFPSPLSCDPTVLLNSPVYTFSCFQDDDFPLYNVTNNDCGYLLTLAIPQQVAPAFSVYPIPAKDRLYLNRDSGGEALVRIFSISGKLVFSQRLMGNEINISGLDAGVYFLRLEEKGKVVSAKVVKVE
jgi:hypothetical protein